MDITFSILMPAIKRHLSIIGKRLAAKEGKNLFSNITTSSAEDPIFEQYIAAGAQNIEAMLQPLVTQFSVGSAGFTLSLRNACGVSSFEDRCMEFIKTYVTLFAVGEYLAMTHPELAAKYQTDATNAIQSLTTYAYYKEPPHH